MGRIDLRVPFAEKGEAKRRGARWDTGQKIWYVPGGLDPAPFQQWRYEPPAPNIRAHTYFLAQNRRECWRCDALTTVHAIVLPGGHERLYVADEPSDDEWEVIAAPTTLLYVAHMQEPGPTRLRTLAPRYKLAYSQAVHQSYWMNHCERCDARLGDYFTGSEFDAAFNPVTRFAAGEICLRLIQEPFGASCGGYAEDMPLFNFMKQCE
ncbi:MAG TPA: DUF5710 domain-containing protein [Steroidobacteraceae bacterium]|nr:DUF5710 domain-containing protein [Steroidobacteraceae bacterium]